MNATVPERAPEEIEKTAAQADGAVEPEAAASQSAPAEPDAAAAADGTAEQADVAAASDQPGESAPEEVRAADEPSMAWHGFLCGFGLWLEALYHALQAGWIFRGGQYYEAEIREMAYAGLPALRALDWALAGVAAVAAALCVLSALKLRKRRSAGPGLLHWTYILLLCGQLALAAGRYFIIGLTPLAVSTLGPLAVYLALLLVNRSYYRRRRECFADAQTGGQGS